jgi:phage terminase small subunit
MVMELVKRYGITYKQALFCLYYDGNATRSARKAECKNPDKNGSGLMKNDGVIACIKALTSSESAPSYILTRNDLMRIWSELARDTQASWKDRLKAMDSLAKSKGIFIDRSQVISNVRVEHLDKLTDAEMHAKLIKSIATSKQLVWSFHCTSCYLLAKR